MRPKKKELIAEVERLKKALENEKEVSAHFIGETAKLKELAFLLAETLDTLNAEIIECRAHVRNLLSVK